MVLCLKTRESRSLPGLSRISPLHMTTSKKTRRRCQNADAALSFYRLTAGWSSPVARQAHNLKVVSSNLAPATNLAKRRSPASKATLQRVAFLLPAPPATSTMFAISPTGRRASISNRMQSQGSDQTIAAPVRMATAQPALRLWGDSRGRDDGQAGYPPAASRFACAM
jgi:hypothetical protein